MNDSLTVLGIGSVIGILTPIVYRRLFGGPWRFSADDYTTEITGLLLAMLITNPIGLLVIVMLSGLMPYSTLVLEVSYLTTNLLLGILGGWIWVVVFLKPIGSKK